MVDLIVPECPRCGADIELRPDGTAGQCRYCDAQVLVLDGNHHPAETEIERRKEAVAMLRRDLEDLEGRAAGYSYQIQAAQTQDPARRSGAVVLSLVLFTMLIFFSAMMTPLFYFLGISYVYGISQSTCPVIGAVLVAIGAAGLAGTWLAAGRLRERRRAQAMQSPGYHEAVREHSLLQPRIQRAREDLERAERDLRALVLGPPDR